MEAFRRHSGALANELVGAHEQAHLLIDIEAEAGFDESVRLTAQLLEFPMAAISILGQEEQIFKAEVGLNTSRTPIDQAFCAYTVREEGVFVVPDAQSDPRFSSNPLVTGALNIRSYAGAPLVMPDGRVLGALCVFDTQRRDVPEAALQTLRLLARQVSIQMQLEELIARQAKDILDLQLARSEMTYMAMHDPLTALLNRRGIFEHLSNVMANNRGISPAATVLFIDLDGFKKLNDTHGHQCGDRALATVARRIKNTIPTVGTTGRLGGDEFVVVLPGFDEDQAHRVATDVLRAIRRPMGREDLSVTLTASIGVASSDILSRPSDVMTRADRAMYAAKQAGGAQVSMGDLIAT